MNMLRHTLIVFAAVMLASCGIYTNYERPEQAVADMDSLYRPEARPDTTRSIATLRWEELFTDTCLQQLIRQGLAANADLAVARLQVEEAQATLRQSKLAYLPSVQLEPTGTLSSFDGQKTQKTYSVGASASWEIDLFGKLRNSKRQAQASLLDISVLARRYLRLCPQISPPMAYYAPLIPPTGISRFTLHELCRPVCDR